MVQYYSYFIGYSLPELKEYFNENYSYFGDDIKDYADSSNTGLSSTVAYSAIGYKISSSETPNLYKPVISIYDGYGNLRQEEAYDIYNDNMQWLIKERDTYDKIDKPDSSIVRYTYDLKGNRQTVEENNLIIDTDNVSYEYDVRNQLTAVTKGTTITTIKYLSDGLRYKKSTPDKTVMYHDNLDGKVSADGELAAAVRKSMELSMP